MTDWPEYESHKVVRAAKIVKIEEIPGIGTGRVITVDPGDHIWERFEPNLANMPAKVGDWAMLYPDGYKSISPAKAFEEGYTRKA
jgi:hypothetical protein